MTIRSARILFALFLCAFAIAVAGPGMVPFNRIRPLVLGLPLSMAWIVAWVVMSGIVLFLLDRSEARGREGPGQAGPHRADPDTADPGTADPGTHLGGGE